ncbi:C40 family peptidase [Micromonospora rubida]|uniref:C40 family peptidase n=1 Tax=Micromonospora rubida TaxID=2697657 RepID=UPI0013785567|nr:C40 family peptidase [Micromonospora rubida]NBE82665.1 NlpC/P60 family protein [Micromonospora rubida]
MVQSQQSRRRQRRRPPLFSPVLRPTLWSALLSLVVTAALATPAYAEPPLPNVVPDTGSRPVAAAGAQLPGVNGPGGLPGTGSTPLAPLGNGPLAALIAAAEAQVGLLGDQLLGLRQTRTEAEAQLATADQGLKTARDGLTKAQDGADAAAAGAFKAAAALPPGEFARDLHGLNMLTQITRGEQADGATTGAAGELARARTAEQLAYQAWLAADTRVGTVREQYAAVEKSLREQEANLLKLRRDNAAQLIELERQQEAVEQQLGASYVQGQSTNGLTASPVALAAVRYALAQLGDPYVWSEEGPDAFDCSGLMWAAYRSAGYRQLPRVSRDQYYATRGRAVSQGALLPGDLLFFASGSSWTTIHHVGMYIGGGKMVQAPTTGQTVKISTVGWSRLYAATRVVGAVPGPPTSPTPKPTKPPTTPKPTPKPTLSPTPTKSPTPKPTTPKPSTTSPPPSSSPTPSHSPSASTPDTPPPAPTTQSSSLAPSDSASPRASTTQAG